MELADMNILELIPQRSPMVMIDELLYCRGKVAGGKLRINNDNVFVRKGFFTEAGMIEAIAQTAAARTGYLNRQATKNGPKVKLLIGVIGSIKDFRLFYLPKVGDELIMEINAEYEFMNASVISGSTSVNGKTACTAELKIFLT